MTHRDTLYEKEMISHVSRSMRFLNSYVSKESHWTETDYLAIERALQILIESFIGFSRYILSVKINIQVTKSREAIDVLRNENILNEEDYKQLIKMVGFRNILVHDYLNIDRNIVQAIIKKRQYACIEILLQKLLEDV